MEKEKIELGQRTEVGPTLNPAFECGSLDMLRNLYLCLYLYSYLHLYFYLYMYLYSYLYLAEGGPTLTLAVEWGCYTLAGNSLRLQQEKTSSIGAGGKSRAIDLAGMKHSYVTRSTQKSSNSISIIILIPLHLCHIRLSSERGGRQCISSGDTSGAIEAGVNPTQRLGARPLLLYQRRLTITSILIRGANMYRQFSLSGSIALKML